LTLLAGRDPEEVASFLALRRKVRAVAGTYESSRGNLTARIEPAGSDSPIRISKPGWEFPAFPESVTTDDYKFHSVWGGGWRGAIEFHNTGDGRELRLLEHRLKRVTAEN